MSPNLERKLKIVLSTCILSGVFLFVLTPKIASAYHATSTYNKDYNGTLTASEWNDLFNDFVNSWLPTSMNGPLGIATSAPASGLEVNGPIKASSFTGSYLGTLSAGNVSSGAFGINTGGGNYSFPGNLGIGTTTPTAALYALGNVVVDLPSSGSATFTEDPAGATSAGKINLGRSADGYESISFDPTLGTAGNFVFTAPLLVSASSPGITFYDATDPGNTALQRSIEYDPDTLQLQIGDSIKTNFSTGTGGPPASKTFFQIGQRDLNTPVSQGIFIGANAPGAFEGDLMHLQVGDSTRFRITKFGDVIAGGSTMTMNGPVLNTSQTWNNSGVDFTAWILNITDTASLATSKLLDMQVGGVSKLVVNKAGNLGIGTTNPTAKIEVGVGNISLRTNGALKLDNTNNNNPWYIGNQGTGAATLSFMTGGQGNQYIKMQLSGEGNLGVGTSTTAAKLYVAGTGFFENTVTVGSPSQDQHAATKGYVDSVISGTSSVPTVGYWTKTGNNIYNANTGNIGIGTTAPTKKLEIQGGTATSGANNFALKLKGTYGGSDWTGILFGATHSDSYNKGGIIFKATDGSNLRGQLQFLLNNVADANTSVTANTDAKMVVDYSGNVGIGTTNPGAKLDIIGPDVNNADLIKIVSNAGSRGVFSIRNGTGVNPSFLLGTHSTSETLGFMTVGTERVRIDSSGNVGINDTTPTFKLDVNGTGQFTNTVVVATPTADSHAATKAYVDSASGGGVGAGTTGQTLRHDGSAWVANSLLYNNGTNIGVGTTNPARLMHLDSAGQTDLHLTSSSQGSTSSDGMTVFVDSSGTGGLWLREAQALRFATAGSERLRIDNTGNVGIGTTNPTYKLDVNGHTRIGDGGGAAVLNFNATIYGGLQLGGATVLALSGSNVGIADTTPSYRLDVNGTGQFTNTVIVATPTAASHAATKAYVDSASGGGVGAGTTGQTLRHDGSAWVANSLLYNNGTNIGVGTTNPIYTLDLTTTGTARAHTYNLATGSIQSNGSGVRIQSGSQISFDTPSSGSTKMYIQATTGNIGIGTTAPSGRLDISAGLGTQTAGDLVVNTASNIVYVGKLDSASGNTQFIFRNRLGGVKSKWDNAGAGSIWFGDFVNGYGVGIQQSGITTETTIPGNAFFHVNKGSLGGTVASFIGGNVGIATTSPAYKLDVDGTGQFTNTVVVATPTADSHAATKAYVDSAAGGGVGAGIIGQTLRHDGSTWVANSALYNDGTNVGIGTTAPGHPLAVAFASSGTTQAGFQGLAIGNTDTTVNAGSAITFGYNGGSNGSHARIGAIYRDRTSSSEDTDLFFGTLGGGGYYERMRIVSTGNVGIGTTNPSGLLNVRHSGNGAVTSLVVEDNARKVKIGRDQIQVTDLSDVSTVMYLQPTGNIYINNTSGIAYFGGNVGVATTSPSAKLAVNGTGKFLNTVIVATPTADSHAATKAYVDSAAGGGIGAGTTGQTLRHDGSTWVANNTLFNNGTNVGIGLTNPAAELDVSDMIRLTRAAGSYYSTIDVEQGHLDMDVNGSGAGYNFRVAGSDKMNITSAGNVGIGNTNPTAKLDIVGADQSLIKTTRSGTNGYIELRSGTGNATKFQPRILGVEDSDGTGLGTFAWEMVGQVDADTAGGLPAISFDGRNAGSALANRPIWGVGSYVGGLGDYKVLVSASGNVGIGSSAPTNILEVKGAIFTGTYSSMSGARFHDNIYGVNLGGNDISSIGVIQGSAYSVGAANIAMQPNGGNIGIGTTAPTYKLDVNGTGQFTNTVVVATPTAGTHAATKDYVDSAAGGGIGAGTTGQTLRHDGSAWVANSVLSNNGSYIGIGTTTPSYLLHVDRGQTPGNVARFSAGGYGGFLFKLNDNIDTLGYGASYRHGISVGGSESMAFLTNNTVNMVLDVNGNLGIGKIAPGQKLDVGGAVAITETTFPTQLNTAGYLWSQNNSVNNRDTTYLSGESVALMYNRNTIGLLLAAGNVGIGTDDPTYKLDVLGTINAGASSGSPTILRGRGGATGGSQILLASNYSPTVGAIYSSARTFLSSNSSQTTINTDNWAKGATTYSSNILTLGISTLNNGTAFELSHSPANTVSGGFYSFFTTPLLTIKEAGNVGIYDSSPDYRLDVNGTGQFTNTVVVATPTAASHAATKAYVDSAAGGGIGAGTTGQTLRHDGSAWIANSMLFNTGNYIGIGTTTPSEKLHIDTADGDGIRMGSTPYLEFTQESDKYRIQVGGSGYGNRPLQFGRDDGGNKVLIPGNVGIGTTAPGDRLHVTPVSGEKGVVVQTVEAGQGFLFYPTGYSETSGASYFRSAGAPGVDHALELGTASNNNIYFQTSGTTKMTILGGGNVGIGTNDPTTKLDIRTNTNATAVSLWNTNAGVSAVAGIYFVNNNVSETPLIGYTSSAYTGYGGANTLIANASSRDFAIVNVSREVARFTNGGNVGIGTTAPTYKLDINGTGQFTNTVVVATPTAGTHAATKDYVDSAAGGGIGAGTTGQTLRHDGSAWVANSLLYNNGTNVGIGTTAPGAKLELLSASEQLRLDYNTSTYVSFATDSSGSLRITPTGYAIKIGAAGTPKRIELNDHLRIYQTGADSSVENVVNQDAHFIGSIASTNSPHYTLNLGQKPGTGHVQTSGEAGNVRIVGDFLAPAASSGSFSSLFIGGTINPDTTATGIARGLYISQTLTQLPTGGYRAIDIPANNASAYGIYQSGVNTRNYFAGNVGIGTLGVSYKLGVVATNNTNGLFVSAGDASPYNARIATFRYAGNSNDIVIENIGGKAGIQSRDLSGQPLELLLQGSGGNVGINDTTPTYKLDVNGTGQFTNTVVVATPTADSHAATKAYVDSAAGGGVGAGTTGQTLRHDGSTWVANGTLFNNGTNVGIGTTAPIYTLDVNGGGNSTISRFYSANASLSRFVFENTNGDNQVDLNIKNTAGNLYLGLGYGDTNAFVDNRSGGRLSFRNSGSEFMTLSTAGNVGIGTTNPVKKLEVFGDIALSNGGKIGQGNGWGTDGNSYNATLELYNGATGYTTLQSATAYGLLLNPAGGNVGIGTTAPTGKLHIADDSQNALRIGSSQVSRIGETDDTGYPGMKIAPYNNTVNFGISTNSNTKLNIWHAGTNYLYIQQNAAEGVISNYASSPLAFQMHGGNVGINDITPSYKLDVNGTGQFTNTVVVATPTAGTHAATKDYVDSAAGGGVGAGTTGQTLRHNGTAWIANNLLYNNGTNVGIGTGNPRENFDIYGSLRVGIDGLLTAYSVSGGSCPGCGTETLALQTTIDGRTIADGLPHPGAPASRHVLALQPTYGYVGIGTIVPEQKLEVNEGNLKLSGTTGYSHGILMDRGPAITTSSLQGSIFNEWNGLSNAESLTSRAYSFKWEKYDGTDWMVINSSGNVGIGTSTAPTKLFIAGDHTQAVTLRGNANASTPYVAAYFVAESNIDYRGRGLFLPTTDASANNSWFVGVPYAGGGFQIGNSSDHNKETATGPYNRDYAKLFIKTDGNVGIGATAPSYKLDVSGTGRFTNTVVVATPTAGTHAATKDYVDSAAGGGIGAGTTGQTLRHNGTAWVANSLLYNNGTNVGVGVTDPGVPFEVSGKIGLRRPGTAAFTTLETTGAGLITNVAAGYHALIVQENGVERMRVSQGTGNVGIGATNALAKLQINEESGQTLPTASIAYSTTGLIVNGIDGAMALASRDDNTAVSHYLSFPRYKDSDGTLISKFGIVVTADTGAQNSNLLNEFSVRYGTNTYDYTNSTLFTIKRAGDVIINAGNLGVNDTTPTYKLDVDGTGQFTNTVIVATPTAASHAATKAYVDSAAGGGFTGSGSNGKLAIWTSANNISYNANVSYSDTAGFKALSAPSNGSNIAIGVLDTRYPYRRIDSFSSDGSGYIHGFGYEEGEAPNAIRMNAFFRDTTRGLFSADQLSVVTFTANEMGGTGLYPTWNTGIQLQASGNSYINGGNLGIGTTAPGEKLTVIGRSRFDSGASFSAVDTGWASSSGYSGGNWGVRLGATASAGIIQAAQSTNIYPLALQPYGGNVGINNASPTYKLDVNGTAQFTNTVVVATPTADSHAATKAYVDSAAGGGIGAGTTGQTLRHDGSTWVANSLLYNNGSQLGVGTTAPFWGQVDVYNSASSTVMIRTSSGQSKLALSENNVAMGYGGFIKYDGVNNLVQIGTQTVDESPIINIPRGGTYSNNVGIGTTDPIAKLAVAADTSQGFAMVEAGETTHAFFTIKHGDSSGMAKLYGDTTNTGSNPGIELHGNYAAGTHTGGAGAVKIKGTEADGAISDTDKVFNIFNNTTELLTILGNGNVGINDTTPSTQLDVKGLAQFDDTNTFATYTFSGSTVQTNSIEIMDRVGGTTSDGFYPTLTFHDYGNGGAQLSMEGSTKILHLASGAYGSAGTLATGSSYFSTLKIHGALDVTTTGNFSNVVTVATPTAAGHAATKAYVDSAAGGGVGAGTTGQTLRHDGSNWVANSLLYNNGTNVGIGTTAPGSKLSIAAVGAANTPLTMAQIFNNIPYTAGNGFGAARLELGHGILHGYIEAGAYSETDSSSGYLAFGNRQPTNNVAEVMRIDRSGNVGIGTTTPSQKLTVYGGGATGQIRMGYSDSSSWSIGRDNITTGDFVFVDGPSTERMRLTHSGNVGIGTTNPSRKLVVMADDNTAPSGDGGQLWLQGATDPNYKLMLGMQTTGSYGFIQATKSMTAAQNLSLNPGGGNVGIGTTAPLSKLAVEGRGRFYSGATYAEIYSDASYAYFGQNANSSQATSLYGAGDVQINIDANNNETNRAFLVMKDAQAGGTTIFRVQEDGNVGIDDATPTYKLDVNGTGQFTNTVIVATPTAGTHAATKDYVDSAAGGGVGAGTTGQTLRHDGSAWVANSLLYNNGTNVGIGTTAPGADLHVSKAYSAGVKSLIINNANTALPSHTSYDTVLIAQEDVPTIRLRESPTSQELTLSVGNEYSNRATIGSTGSLTFSTGRAAGAQGYADSGTRMSINSTGNVGIGTTAPATKLDIRGASATNAYDVPDGQEDLRILSSNNRSYDGGILTIGGASGVTGFIKTAATNSSAGDLILGNRRLIGDTFMTAGIVLKTSGYVGIGTTAPTTKLYVTGTGHFDNTVVVATPTAGTHAATKDYVDSASGGGVGAGTTGQTLRHNGTAWIANNLLYNNGTNVGIGTTNPGSILEVAAGSPTIKLNDLAGGARDPLLQAAGSIFSIGDSSIPQAFNIQLSSGNVGIGTTAPVEKLQVAGNIDMTGTDRKIYMGGAGGTTFGLVYNQTYPNYGLFYYRESSPDFVTISPNGGGITSPVAFFSGNGNVGIGTTAPSYKLDVNGTGRFANTVVVATPTADSHAATKAYVDSASGGGVGAGTTGQTLRHNGTGWVADSTLYNNGTSVGVGTANPIIGDGTYRSSLTVSNSTVAGTFIALKNTDTSLKLSGLWIQENTNNAGWLFGVHDNGNAIFNYGSAANETAALGAARSESTLVLTTGGNVGIGTTAPTTKLEVVGTVKATAFSGPLSGTISSANVSSGAFGANTGGGNYSFPGRLGIGTSTPSTDLEIKGSSGLRITESSDPRNYIQIYEDQSTGGILEFTSNGGPRYRGTIKASDFNFQTYYSGAWTDMVKILNNGNVGIGYTNPGAPLHVYRTNAVNPQLIIENTATYRAAKFGFDTGSASGYGTSDYSLNIINMRGTDGDFGVRAGTSGNVQFILKGASGNVGIGLTNPSAKLHVSGDAIITGTLTTQTGSDFAEEFVTDSELASGTVVVMGDLGYKSVKASNGKYDSKVVGVVSDNPSIIAGKVDSDNKAIVAMMGVVTVKVCDQNGTIEKGDLLTTSDVAGYAMKAKKFKEGTIIGKALEDLNSDRGEVKVLVNLQ